VRIVHGISREHRRGFTIRLKRLKPRAESSPESGQLGGFTIVRGGFTFVQGGLDIQI